MKILAVIFVIMFLGMYLVTNAQLLMDNIQDRIAPQQVASLQGGDMHSSAALLTNSLQKMKKVEELMQKYSEVVSIEKEIAPEMTQVLRENIDKYEFDFNLLPPTNRLIIPSINLDVPLVYTQIKDATAFNEGSFDTELENGVVKYPTTPNPGEGGNAFFFGHTSQEYRKHNKYGTVFRNIPKLTP
jgi:sortase (surface protein transpeptidase)